MKLLTIISLLFSFIFIGCTQTSDKISDLKNKTNEIQETINTTTTNIKIAGEEIKEAKEAVQNIVNRSN